MKSCREVNRQAKMFQLCCRTCLEQTNYSELRSLFDTYNGFVLRDAVLELFQIEVHQTDMLSTICKQCVEKLCTARDIRKQFLERNQKYRQMTSNEGSNSADLQLEASSRPAASNGDSSPAVESTTKEDAGPILEIETADTDTDNRQIRLVEVTLSSDEDSLVYVLERVEPLDDQDADYEIKLVPDSPHTDLSEHFETVELVNSESESCATETPRSTHATVNGKGRVMRKRKLTEGLDETYYDSSLSSVRRVTGQDSSQDLTARHRYKQRRAKLESHDQLKKHTVSSESSHSKETKLAPQASSEQQNPNHEPSGKKKRKTENEQEKPDRCATSHLSPTNSGSERADSAEEKTETQFECHMVVESFPQESQLDELGKLDHGAEVEVHLQESPSEGRSRARYAKRRFHCRFCPKSFVAANALEGHENTHTRQQSFYCSVCTRSFAQYTSMRRHMKIHNEIKSHACDFCDARFRQRSVMLAHRRRHTGEKPYECPSCSKTFRDHSTFSKHRRVHQLKHNRYEGSVEDDE
uniref:Protein krueppel n=1 Tax=Anopheles atroparvus TaxID=41427 RepID=A0AAG5CW92_ANOAO